MRYKDCLKATLKKCGIDEVTWESKALERGQWRKEVFDGKNNFENERVIHNKLKRDVRKRHINEAADEMGNQIRCKCDICDRLCLTRAGLKSHQKVHQSHRQINYSLSDATCRECGKVRKCAAGLKNHVNSRQKRSSASCQSFSCL